MTAHSRTNMAYGKSKKRYGWSCRQQQWGHWRFCTVYWAEDGKVFAGSFCQD